MSYARPLTRTRARAGPQNQKKIGGCPVHGSGSVSVFCCFVSVGEHRGGVSDAGEVAHAVPVARSKTTAATASRMRPIMHLKAASQVVGCTSSEIAEFEQALGVEHASAEAIAIARARGGTASPDSSQDRGGAGSE